MEAALITKEQIQSIVKALWLCDVIDIDDHITYQEALAIIESLNAQEQSTWHHPDCHGQCIACLIESTVEKEYGSAGLNYLNKHIHTVPPTTPDSATRSADSAESFCDTHCVHTDHHPECKVTEQEPTKDMAEWRSMVVLNLLRITSWSKHELRELAVFFESKLPIAQPEQEPMFWYRPLRDGMYEGPIHNNSVGGKMYRDEAPNEWKPLYTAPISEPVKERISEPVENLGPVAWMASDNKDIVYASELDGTPESRFNIALYAAPPKREYFDFIHVEPSYAQLRQVIAGLQNCFSDESKSEFLKVWIRDWTDHQLKKYTAPPKRVWQGLTDEEIGFLAVFDGLHHVETPLLANLIRAIETKLKSKNGGQND